MRGLGPAAPVGGQGAKPAFVLTAVAESEVDGRHSGLDALMEGEAGGVTGG